jgi:hypothetical protein
MNTQQRPRGFAPLFRGPYIDQNMRVSDAERQAVADRLAEHFSDGRLDHAEFDERVGRAMSAKTRADLAGLMDDLPETALPGTALPGTGAPAVPAPSGRPRRRPVRGFLTLVLIVVLLSAVGHATLHALTALLWIGLIVAALIFAARGRPRHDQQQ